VKRGESARAVFTILNSLEGKDYAQARKDWPAVKVELQEAAIRLRLQGPSGQAHETGFSWVRAVIAFALLIVIELSAVAVALVWGEGSNLVQKIGNCWWLLTAAFTVVIVASYFIFGKAGWSKVKKLWPS
jgi:hypothetical protein